MLEVNVMPFTVCMPSIRPAGWFWAAVLLAGSFTAAQSALAQDQSSSTGYSSSQAQISASGLQLAEFSLPDNPNPGASASGGGSGQYGNGGGYSGGGSHGLVHKLAFEAGGGFNPPAGDKAYITWGGEFTVGGGLNFSKRLALLAEYQFMDDKLPGAIIAEAGATGGYIHIWSFTLDPVVSLFPKSSNDVYVTGGYGFYRKVTSFTDPTEAEYCDYFYGCWLCDRERSGRPLLLRTRAVSTLVEGTSAG